MFKILISLALKDHKYFSRYFVTLIFFMKYFLGECIHSGSNFFKMKNHCNIF